jgi:hypothetical protein
MNESDSRKCWRLARRVEALGLLLARIHCECAVELGLLPRQMGAKRRRLAHLVRLRRRKGGAPTAHEE